MMQVSTTHLVNFLISRSMRMHPISKVIVSCIIIIGWIDYP